jgi:hypothetical protein
VNAGHWSVNWSYFAAAGVDNAPLHALAVTNGAFAYGSTPAFPRSTHQSSNYWVDVVFNGAAPVAPSITSQPANSSATLGQTATFAVTATGTAPLTYQWKKNGASVGANSSSYTTPATISTDNDAQFTVVVSNSVSSVTSNPAMLTVNTPPAITTQPVSQTVIVGHSATFSVAATGTAPLTYQWKKNGAPIGGAISSSYSTPATISTDNGAQFTVVVSNLAGNATSNPAPLTVNTPPAITTQPVGQTVMVGQPATFSVAATGTAPMAYQWQKGGVAIAGARSSAYTTGATLSTDNGAQFTVMVSNAVSNVMSNPATLTVNTPNPLQITTSQLSGGTVAAAYTATFNATGGSPSYSWTLLSGALPPGLSLNTAGNISGTPTLAGNFPFMVQVKDTLGNAASGTFSINIGLPQPTIAITSPANGSSVAGAISVTGTAADTVGLTSAKISIDGGSYSNVSGTNNWSFSLNTNSLSNGSHTLTAQITDVAGITATSAPVTITVNNGALATDCTLYASSSGNDSNPGTSPAAPKTIFGAAALTQPGSVLCLMAGTYQMNDTFYPPASGSPSAWIVYKAFGDGAVNFIWAAGAIAQPMFKFGNGSFPSNPAYLEFRDLNLDGQNNALDGFFCHGSHHLRFMNNTINNTGGSGVGAVSCDYLTSDHNMINHNGYLYGWTSGISYNNTPWFDSYPGFHNIISNNIVVGEFDGSTNHTDGNGIILDLGGNTPSALIINNVVYGNGGRCIQANGVTNFWFVNNTCYKNNLDPSLGNAGSLTSQNSNNGYFINNIVVAWHSNNPSYDQEGSNSNIAYYADMYSGSSINFTPANPSQLIQADPLFVTPPPFDPNAAGQYATALAPDLLGNGLTLQSTSPAYNRGIDPSQLSGVPPNIVADLKQYIYVDINGKPRPQGGGSDLGAYQH